MQVRLRLEEEPTGPVLGEIPLTDEAVTDVLALLRRWGVVSDVGDMTEVAGQFRVDDNAAYFEVVIFS